MNVWFKLAYYDASGTRQTETLEDEPINWDKVNIIIKRDTEYFGVNYQFTDGDIQLRFDKVSGYELIKSIVQRDGNDADIVLQYGHYDGITEVTDYEGKLDLNTYQDKDDIITCTIGNTGFHELINSRSDTKVNLFDTKTIDGSVKENKGTDMTLHSKSLMRKTQVIQGDEISELVGGGSTGMYFTFGFIDVSSQFNQIKDFKGTPLISYRDAENVHYDPSTRPDPPVVFDIKEGGRYTFKLDITTNFDLSWEPETPLYRLQIFLVVSNLGVEKLRQSIFDTDITDEGTALSSSGLYMELKRDIPVQCSVDVTLDANDQVMLIGHFTVEPTPSYPAFSGYLTTKNIKGDVILSAFGLTYQPDSTAKGILIFEAFESIVHSITNQANSFISEYLGKESNGYGINGPGSLFAILNGFFIRNFDIANRALSISLKELLSSVRNIFAVGFGYEYDSDGKQFVRIEPIEYFFQENEIISIANCSEYSEDMAKEMIFNEVEVGYNKYPDEGEYQLDDINTELSFITPIKTNKNKLSIKSELISSGFAIEETRRAQKEESTTYDDDPFIIAVQADGDGWKSEAAENFDTENILDGTTSYNLRITPKRNLYRWAKWINGCLKYKKGSEVIKNTLFKMNGAGRTKEKSGGIWIQENQDVILNDFENRNRFFDPIWISFKCRLTMAQIVSIRNAFTGRDEAKKNGYISVKNADGDTVSGWHYELTYNPSKEEATFKLLKRGINSDVINCESYANFTSADFEAAPVPDWIEDCTFDNFN
jgi:hypothetical protein